MELDSAKAVSMLNTMELNRSPLTFFVQDIQRLIHVGRSFQVVAIHRDQNNVSNSLENLMYGMNKLALFNIFITQIFHRLLAVPEI
jgi:hypothetical protein